MTINSLSENWPKTIALVVLTALLFWGYGCPARTPSLTRPDEDVTRGELQIELDSIIATAEYRFADLKKQEQFRDLIFQNVLVMANTGTMNPAGILTLLAGLYGVAHGVKDVKDKVKKNKLKEF